MKQILRYALSFMLVAAPMGMYAEGTGTQADPVKYMWFDQLTINGPGAAQSPSDYTYHEVTCRAEGVMEITNNTNAYQIALLKNGVQVINSIAKNGATTSVLVKMGDIITLKMISQDDQSGKTIELNWRAPKTGEQWNEPITLSEGENEVPAIRNNVDMAQWYKVTVPAGAKMTLTMPYATAMVYTADEAASEVRGSAFESTDKGIVYTYNNTENRKLDIYVKVSAINTAGTAVVSYEAAEQSKGTGTQDDPYILAWDTESFNAPAAGAKKVYYQLTSNNEGVMHIDADAIVGDFVSDLYINGVRKGNGVTRDILINRGDVILFTYMCREDNSENQIKLSHRAIAEGEIWNMPVILSEGENATTVVAGNIDLAKWYKVSVPAMAKLTLTMPYADAMVYTADQAAKENRGSAFENLDGGMVYTYNNLEGRIVDLYVKVSAQNNEGNAVVGYAAAEQHKGTGIQEDPYILDWETESFKAPASGMDKTYYQLTSNYEGVMQINCDAIEGQTLTDLIVNDQRIGNVVTREILINRGDVVTFAIACEKDNSANDITIAYRKVADGDVWNSPIALAEGDNTTAAVKNNIDLAKWYKVSVPAQAKLTLTMPYATAMVYTADEAASEVRGSAFENTADGILYTYNNAENRKVDLYVKVSAQNAEGTANVSFAAAEQHKGTGVEEDPYILDWDAEGFNAPAAGYDKTYYQLTSNYEGVLQINTEAIEGQTVSDLILNGQRIGNVVTREVVINRGDVVTFAIACEKDNTENQVALSYRKAAQGDVWNSPIIVEGEIAIPVIKNNIDLARWYKVVVPAGAKMTMTMGQGIAMAYTADTAAKENMGATFANGEDGTMSYTYNNPTVNYVDVYVKVSAMNEACTATVNYDTAEQSQGTGIESDPYIVAWDAEGFYAPAAASSADDKTYYQLKSNYEGVLQINTKAIIGSMQSDLFINGERVGNVVTREILVNRGDIVTFAIACELDNTQVQVALGHRPVAEGEIWNQPITLAQGETEIPVIKNNINLAQWYKVTVPAQAKMTLTMPYGVAMVYTADEAASQVRGSVFENTESGMVYVYNNIENRTLDLYVKVSAINEAGNATVEYAAADMPKGTGTEDDPYILAWDAEGFNAPAAGYAKTYYQLTSNYEGIMQINTTAIKGAMMSDLYVNGVRIGNVVTREILVNRADIVKFAIACEEDNSESVIGLHYRAAAEGEVWNQAIALAQGENAIGAVMQNINLDKWYKVTVPAQAKMTVTMPYGVAMVYTADTAAEQARGTMFENTEDGMVYVYNNTENRTLDLYIKVSAMNEAGTAVVSYEAAEQPKGTGTAEDPYILAWDAEGFNAPAAGAQKTYYQLTSNYEGVMSINTDAIQGYTMTDLIVDGARIGNVVTREILVKRGEVITFAIACEQDNSENQIKLAYRQIAEGEVWNRAIAIEGETAIPAVALNVDLAKWFKVAVPANAKATIKMPQAVAMVYTADTAGEEARGSVFENTEDGMIYVYNNNENRALDLYIKVSANNAEGVATVTIEAADQPQGDGTQENPYILAWDAEGFNAPASSYSKTYYQLVSNYEGVMQINTEAIQGSTMTDLIVNGARIGNVITREILVNRGDTVVFAIACELDNTENQVKLAYRTIANGDVWNQPIELTQGDNAVPAIKNNVDLAKWYKVAIPAKAKVTVAMPYGIAVAYTADEAAQEVRGSVFENTAEGISYVYNNTEDRNLIIYIKASSLYAEGVATVTIEAADEPKGTGTQDDPYILDWDAEGFNAPAANYSKTYYQLVSNYEGVMSIDASAIQGYTMTDLIVNGVRKGNLVTREILIERGDVVTFAIACEQDNTENQIKLAYRPVAEGEVWNMAIALNEGDNNVEAIAQNINLAKWYKIHVPANDKVTVTMPYGVAMVYTADTAAQEIKGASFENTEKGMVYVCENNEAREFDLYIKVSALNEAGVAVVETQSVSGIMDIMIDAENGAKIYDLNGIAVKQAVKGKVYIVNGKKVRM